MMLATKIKQQTHIQSCIKYQKLYSTKIKLLSKLLVCLLAINCNTAGAAKTSYSSVASPSKLGEYHAMPKGNFHHSATGTCFLGAANHATPTSVVTGGISKVSPSSLDLDKGIITIDPAKMEVSDTSPLTAYISSATLSCSQEVSSTFVYEYISNHAGSGKIDDKSSIYFGLTPATDTNNNYCLAAFDYEPSSTYYPALTIHTNEFNKRLSKDTLKSIVICSRLNSSLLNNIQGSLYISGTSTTTTLTDGLIIAKSANLTGVGGLVINENVGASRGARGIKLKADIINYGKINDVVYGVSINATSTNSFCLLPPNGGTTARFYNYGCIDVLIPLQLYPITTKAKAFKIMGKKSTEVDTFELINHYMIKGGLQLVESSDKTKTINFNVVNYGTITTYATKDAVHITNYTGKPYSKLSFQFDASSTGAIAHCGESFNLEEGARIVLEVSGTTNLLTAKSFTIAESKGGINLAQGTDMIVTPINDNYIISTTAINMTDSKIEATLTAVAPPTSLSKSVYMPAFVPVVNALKNIQNASKTAGAIAKIISDNTEIAGVNLNKFITNKDFQQSNIFNIAKNYNSSADEFFDILLPDSSNSQLSCNHALANKIASQVSARLNGKAMAPIKTGSHQRKIDNQGITSGEVIDNISVWTAFNYFQNKTKSNDDKQSYNNFKAMTFSLGTDGELEYKATTVGLSYGFCSGNNKVLGGLSGNQLSKTVPGIYDEEDLKTHTFTLYSAMNIQPVDMQVAFSFGSTKHTPKTGVNLKDYKSSIIGINFATTYPLDIEEFNIDFTGSLGVNIINTEKHDGKDPNEKDSKSLVSLGLMSVINDIVTINDNIDLDYRFGIGGKYTISDDKSSSIIVANKSVTNPTSIDYKKRQISPFNFNIDTNLNFQIQKNTHLGIDFNFGMGKASMEFGIATSVRYMF